MPDAFSLEGHVVVITGGLGNLGRRYARAVIDRGGRAALIDVAPAASRPELLLQDYLVIQGDVCNKATLISARERIEEELGPITGLINNAAIDSPPDASAEETGPFESYPETSWDRIMDVNVKGSFLASQVFASIMAARGRGSVINISSIYGLVSPDQRLYEYLRAAGHPFYKPIAYSASKSALLSMSRYLATYWGRQGVRVNSLILGGVHADQDEKFVQAYEERVPLGRMATPDDHVGPVVFLLSDASRYVTGADIVVDGGWTAW